MLCRKPFVQGDVAYGCGQCLPCRIKRRRIWVHRLLLESALHAESSFVTVTYTAEKVPVTTGGLMTLDRSDYRRWLKRLRKKMVTILPDWRLRFFLVGEYGDENWRPHFHAALFGYRGCEFGDWYVYSGQDKISCTCVSCKIIHETWGKGRIHQGVVERKSAQYLAGYTVKGMTSNDRSGRLRGREPEFARMSLRPGIGADAAERIVASLESYGLDSPGGLRHGLRVMPLGRYIKSRVSQLRGSEEADKARSLDEWRKELQALREAAAALSEKQVYVEGTFNHEIFKALLVEQDAEKVRQIEARRKLYERGKK